LGNDGNCFLSIFIGVMLARTFEKYSLRIRITLYSIIYMLVILEFSFPMHFVPVETYLQFLQVYYTYISSLPRDSIILELPIHNWYNQPYNQKEIRKQYYSTIHFRKVLNGASGYAPDAWMKNA